MTITVDGRQAAVKQGTSFTIVSENRRFSGADGYTLNITFPLAGCPRNIEIFGDLTRWDQSKEARRYECDIYAGRLYRHGMLTVTEVTEQDVKCQFLEGRSVRNFREDLSKVYIDQMPIGPVKKTGDVWAVDNDAKMYKEENVSTAGFAQYKRNALDPAAGCVALTWINNSSGNVQNEFASLESIDSDTQVQASYMMYLIDVFRSVCIGLGFSFDCQAWEDEPRRWLLMANTLPAAWERTEFRHALPHWTVEEFFEQLEWFLDAEIDVDFIGRHVSMIYVSDYYPRFGEVVIDKVVHEFSAQIGDEEVDYTDNINIGYGDAGTTIDRYRTNMWFVKALRNGEIEYQERICQERGNGQKSPVRDFMLVDGRYYVWRTIMDMPYSGRGGRYWPEDWYRYVWLQEVNQYAPYIGNPESDEIKRQLGIVPAWIESVGYTEDGMCLFLDCGNLDETEEKAWQKTSAALKVEDCTDNKDESFFNNIFVAYWDNGNAQKVGKYVRPYTGMPEELMLSRSLVRTVDHDAAHPSLRLCDRQPVARIKPGTKFKIQFLMDDMPDARAQFIIRGKRYACAKVTATVNELGLSRLMNGEFYEMG